MMAGLIVAFWAALVMTAGHLFFAAAGSAYIAVGIRFEERDLRLQLGDAYRDYADRVPAFAPLCPRLVPPLFSAGQTRRAPSAFQSRRPRGCPSRAGRTGG
jgi:hypothetical protein